MKRFSILSLCLIATSLSISPARSGPLDVPAGPNLRRTVTVEVAEKTKDAVVYISTKRIVNQRFSPFGDEFFNEAFPQFQQIRRVPGTSLGSGFIIHPDGYIVTNHHVIDSARAIEVQLLDGTKLNAELISSNPQIDLAILRIQNKNGKPLPAIDLGDSSDLMIGEPVIAVGNPLGLSHTVSTGIISALHRDVQAADKVALGDLIQTDTAINRGNSGGPLLNAYGQVIGINTAIRTDAQNIGFAIPVNRLRDMIPSLMNPAQVTKVDIPLKLSEKRELSAPANVKATVCRADDGKAMTSIAGQQPRDIVDAYAILLRQENGKSFKIALADKEVQIDPKSVPLPDAVLKAKERLGVTVEQLTPMSAQQYGLSQDAGLLVREVAKNSIGAKAGLRPGDLIVQMGNYWVLTLDNLAGSLDHLPDLRDEDGRVRVGIIRKDRLGYGYFEL